MDDSTLLLLLLPLVLIELAMKVVALLDLWRRRDLDSSAQWGWTAAIVLISIFGWLAYLVFGRQQRRPAP